jgi:multisubunit Na+/H+ antiporter MnhC subunit
MSVTLGHFLSLGAMLFALSVVGIFLNRRNLIVLLMAIELMLLAVNMNFVAFSYYLGVRVLHPDGGGGGVRHRPGHPGAAVPQQVEHQRRRTERAQGLITSLRTEKET